MSASLLKIHPKDTVIVALQDLTKDESYTWAEETFTMQEDIPAKHKFSTVNVALGEAVIMYGVQIGQATKPILKGGRITTENVKHAASPYSIKARQPQWTKPDIRSFAGRTFQGFHRADGKVGTRNYWIVFPLVFCENRNIQVIEEAMLTQLGYRSAANHVVDVSALIHLYQQGASVSDILQADIETNPNHLKNQQLFPNVDGIKFLKHEGGCGGIRQDSESLCRLLAGYIANPNVAGATVLSLGCQNAQYQMLEKALNSLHAQHGKPVFILEQQQSKSERDFIAEAVKQTFAGLMEANQQVRKAAPLQHLVLGLECGGSDGFSGITANPALGHCSDLLVALGGSTILSEFPELNGVEQELIDRCTDIEIAEKFARLMKAYSEQAQSVGSGFDMNPSPGNIKDGLITDAMKSAGAAKKGGTAPVSDVLDYTEPLRKAGLNLLCTPGNDVESTTGLAGSGANLIVFTTGLGTPTGNPIAPTIKMATNTALAQRMADIVDIDAGTIISGNDSIESKGAELLELLIDVASGKVLTKAEQLGQDDFIPWKRGVSL